MEQTIKDIVEYAFTDKLSNMKEAITNALSEKTLEALRVKKIEIAQDFFKSDEQV